MARHMSDTKSRRHGNDPARRQDFRGSYNTFQLLYPASRPADPSRAMQPNLSRRQFSAAESPYQNYPEDSLTMTRLTSQEAAVVEAAATAHAPQRRKTWQRKSARRLQLNGWSSL